MYSLAPTIVQKAENRYIRGRLGSLVGLVIQILRIESQSKVRDGFQRVYIIPEIKACNDSWKVGIGAWTSIHTYQVISKYIKMLGNRHVSAHA